MQTRLKDPLDMSFDPGFFGLVIFEKAAWWLRDGLLVLHLPLNVGGATSPMYMMAITLDIPSPNPWIILHTKSPLKKTLAILTSKPFLSSQPV